MTVKIDRFKIVESERYSSVEEVGIIDYLEYRSVIDFRTKNKEVNMALAKIVLDQLNSMEWSDMDD